MYHNLQIVLTESNYSMHFIAHMLGISQNCFIKKLNQQYDFTFYEYQKLCALFNDYSPRWLFAVDTEKNGT